MEQINIYNNTPVLENQITSHDMEYVISNSYIYINYVKLLQILSI